MKPKPNDSTTIIDHSNEPPYWPQLTVSGLFRFPLSLLRNEPPKSSLSGSHLSAYWQPLVLLVLTPTPPWDPLYPSPPQPQPKLVMVLSLQEVARVNGLVKVEVTYSLNKHSQMFDWGSILLIFHLY